MATTVFRSDRITTPTRAGISGGYSSPVSRSDKMAEFWTREEADLYKRWQSSFDRYNVNYSSPYFDYFFSGQDVSVSIEGLDQGDELPIYTFGYVIEQQKQPVYGFWSYTYDAVLRGTRIISGAFSVVSQGPITMTKLLAKAANNRSKLASNRSSMSNIHAVRGLDEDEANIDRFWHRHYDSNLESRQQHIFSVHPPFNFIIQFGLQETSLVANNPNTRANEFRFKYINDGIMATDFNERLVKNPSVDEDYQVLLENVELMNMSTQYDTEGNPILETYAFIARDQRFLSEATYTQPKVLNSGGGGGPGSQLPV